MNIADLKERLFDSLSSWADLRIDEMAKGNATLAIPSVYMKRAAHNMIARNREKWSEQIDNVSLFIADENGNIDADTIFSDIMNMMQSADDKHLDIGIVHCRIDKGIVSIDLPDNMLTTFLFGSKKCINLTEADFKELKELITK